VPLNLQAIDSGFLSASLISPIHCMLDPGVVVIGSVPAFSKLNGALAKAGEDLIEA
jgi:hypothetical protein